MTSQTSSRSSLFGVLAPTGLRRCSQIRKASFLSLWVSVSLASDRFGCPFRSPWTSILLIYQTSCQELAKIGQDPDESQTIRKDTPHINHRLPRGIAKPGSRGRRWPAARHLQSAAPSGVRGVPIRKSISSISSPEMPAGFRRPSPKFARTPIKILQKSIL